MTQQKNYSLNEYARDAMRSAKPIPEKGPELAYCGLAISGEAGEVADLIKKVVFQDKPLDAQTREKLILEAGDVLWGIARLAKGLNVTLEDIALANIEKLKARYPEGWDPERANNRPKES